eukprot:scaffold9894_cov72-Skeletonema_dohrnii-CCMP3373.AAC.1
MMLCNDRGRLRVTGHDASIMEDHHGALIDESVWWGRGSWSGLFERELMSVRCDTLLPQKIDVHIFCISFFPPTMTSIATKAPTFNIVYTFRVLCCLNFPATDSNTVQEEE